MLKSHKIRCYPTPHQEIMFAKTFGCNRFLWNKLVAMWKDGEQIPRNPDVHFKKEFEWLGEVEAHGLKYVKIHWNQSWNMWKKTKNKPPTFKKKFAKQAYTTCQPGKRNGRYQRLSKVGWVKLAQEPRFVGVVKSVTVSKAKSGKYFISYLIDTDDNKLIVTDKQIGIDLGLMHFLVDSEGSKVDNPKFLRTNTSMIKAQRSLSRKKIGSNNFYKQKIKLAKEHEKIANQRLDFLHKLSSMITNENQVIFCEDLNVKGLLKNHKLARAISDVSWSEFVRQLDYKSKWKGGYLHKVDRFYPSSQICSCCGHRDGKKALNIREWVCPNCETTLDRDVNAAINILTVGRTEIAC